MACHAGGRGFESRRSHLLRTFGEAGVAPESGDPGLGDRAWAQRECLNDRVGNDDRYLLAVIELAQRAREHGNHPFGALLVDADGNVVVKSENTVVTGGDCTGHAETNLMRIASQRFSPEFLRGCTLYASTEPCVMCAGAIYWGDVRRVVFALSEDELRDIVGANPENPTLALPCREVFARGRHEVEVSGPRLQDQARAVHEGFWA
jgi:tRNA(Arg) A34 adenosine deaminase TadA